ncbi:MAG TPA: Rieske 2Fe-2S domain-containing protein [Chloroflexota bacterium]|nr:Rieske 2Fe-2S domain-containing protein [Chloroflexota bacterium]
MLSPEENELLTRVGPGTPCGELFRRYWLPIAPVSDRSDRTPTTHVRVLGEDLVLFRDAIGKIGLLGDHCSHRGASLLYGRVEERGIACAYHGWLYDVDGNCLETPAEPHDSRLHRTVKHPAYPVQEQYGLYWAYLGPRPAPVLPRWDIADFGPVFPTGAQRFDCNWLQGMENHMDQAHVFILHQDSAQRGVAGMSTARGRIDSLQTLEYAEEPFGIRRRQRHASGYDDVDLMIFPNAQRTYNHIGVRVPIDDHHMVRYSVWVDVGDVPGAARPGRHPGDLNGGAELRRGIWPTKSPADAVYPVATYRMDGVQAQDLMALETQGAIADRTQERLATSDRGILLYREVLKREIEKVRRGVDPVGVIRDPDVPPINTYFGQWLAMVQRFPPQPR